MRFGKEILDEYEGDRISNEKQTTLGKVELRRAIVRKHLGKSVHCMLMNVDFVDKDSNCVCF